MTATILPLVVRCPAASVQNPAQTGGATEPILTVQMDTLGGQIYLVPLSATAAKTLLVTLASWPPIQDYLSERGLPAPTKLQ
jgi:hypothetical protein